MTRPPSHVGVIGPRGAGKTALLAMLYREALAGRLASVHLHAADSVSAAYLRDAALDLDSGSAPEPNSAPVTLRLTLERAGESIDLVVHDGAAPPGCAAVWLCLPAAEPSLDGVDMPATCPAAVVLTKADQLAALGPQAVRAAGDPFAGHPLAEKMAKRATFAVSSTGPTGMLPDGRPVLPTPLAPTGIEAPLAWLAEALHRPAPPPAPPPLPFPWLPALCVLSVLCVVCAAFALRPQAAPPEQDPPAVVPPVPVDDGADKARLAREAEAAREAKARADLAALDKSMAPLAERVKRAEAMVKGLGGAPPTNEARALLARLRLRQAEATAAEASRRRGEGVALYRKLRDAYKASPADVKGLRAAARGCVDADPMGPHAKAAGGVLRYCDAMERPGEYKVTLVSGVFSKKAAFALNSGVKLSVALEVGGESYGPSTMGVGGYFPEWNHAFSRPVKWKPGDTVRVIVTDHYLFKRPVADTLFDEPGAIRRLDDFVEVDKGTLNFESEFPLPRLPRAD